VTGALESALRRDRAIVLTAFVAVVVITGLDLVRIAGSMSEMG
jgi:hypothetical protein